MTAREYFERARDAQRSIDRRLAVMASMRAREAVRAQRYGVGGGSGKHDAMAATDARIDAETAMSRDLQGAQEEVEDARRVCRGIRLACPSTRWGDALELRYIEDMAWTPCAAALGISERMAQADVNAALDWVDAVGIAAAREGMGQATLF